MLRHALQLWSGTGAEDDVVGIPNRPEIYAIVRKDLAKDSLR